MDKGDERRAKYTIDHIKEIISESTDVVNWYAHHDSVRGPFGRWFIIKEGNDQGNIGVLAEVRNDIEYAATAMNALPSLVDRIENLESKLQMLKETLVEIKTLSEDPDILNITGKDRDKMLSHARSKVLYAANRAALVIAREEADVVVLKAR